VRLISEGPPATARLATVCVLAADALPRRVVMARLSLLVLLPTVKAPVPILLSVPAFVVKSSASVPSRFKVVPVRLLMPLRVTVKLLSFVAAAAPLRLAETVPL
ncbi:MAG: hypothetical protein ACK56I_27920, partial [bacterium]